MKITKVGIFQYRLPLRQPLKLNELHLTEREGFLIRLESDSGSYGWGETAPLPGFSNESHDEAADELNDLRQSLLGQELPTDLTLLTGQLLQWLSARKLSNSVRYGLEMAVLNLMANARTVPLAQLLTEQPQEAIHINALIADNENIKETTRRLCHDRYRAIKLKVGRGKIENDIRCTQDAFRELSNNTTLRLDANRAWSYDEAVRFAEAISDCEIEYIEEPLIDTTRLREFTEQTGLPIALDETTRDMEPQQLTNYPFVRAVVLKPTLLGGFERTAAFARVAHEHDMKAIISSCFESSVGIASLVQFAAAFGTLNTPVGLDTLDWFQHDLLTEPINCSHGQMQTSQVARVGQAVNRALLTEVNLG